MGFFQAIQQKISGASAAKGFLGVDIGSSAIKVVQLRSEHGSVVLDTYGEIALGPYAQTEVGQATNLPAEKLTEALREVCKEAEVTAKVCGVSVPFSSSLVKLIEVPPMDAQKLATVIPIEARKYVPVPINEVQLDWFVVPETEQRLFEGGLATTQKDSPLSRRLVLVVAMHDEVLRRYNTAIEGTGLSPRFYEIEVFSSVRATVSHSIAPVAILDIGAGTVKLYLVELGIVLASHVISVGSQDITRSLARSTHISIAKAEEIKRQTGIIPDVQDTATENVSHVSTLTMEHVFAEARRVIANFQKKYNKVITKVILVGGGATLKGVDVFARQQLEIEIEVARPFSHIQTPVFLEQSLAEAGPTFATAIGIALRGLHEDM